MSKLWSQILEQIRIIGNNSGCHQMPERSFFYKGKQFPVCARCTGVTIGQFLAILFLIFRKTISVSASLICLVIMGVDWGLQECNIKPSTNIRRLITGILGGFGVIGIYSEIFKKIVSYFKYFCKRL